MTQRRLEIAALPFQRRICSGDHPHIHLPYRTAHRLNLPLLQRSQQLRLHLCRGVTNFIEKQAASLGLLKIALARPIRPGERSLGTAEQGRSRQLRRNSGHIDTDQRGIGPATGAVNCGGYQFLTRAGLTPDKNIQVTLPDLQNLLAQPAIYALLPRN